MEELEGIMANKTASATATKAMTMDELLATSEVTGLNTGDVVDGTVTAIRKNEIWVDLGARGVGVVMRREIGHGQEL